MSAVATGVLAAFLAGFGFVVQQRVAAHRPPTEMLRLRLLLHLAKRPVWLIGIAVMVGGQLLGAMALSRGGLGLVEPLLATNLLFALVISAAWKRQHLAPREWIGAITLAAGLGGFVAAGRPGGGHVGGLPWPNWAVSIGAIVAVAAALVVRSRRGPRLSTGRHLGAAAGILFGLQDALTRRTVAVVPHDGVAALFTQWPTYLLVSVGLGSVLVAQSAFEAAPLSASLAPMTLAEPLTGIAFGAGVYSEHLGLDAGTLALEVVSLAAACVGVWLVAASDKLVVREPPVGARSRAGDAYPGGTGRPDARADGRPGRQVRSG
jgi:drug/metabolite transporter (DMT)-like permease